MPILPPFKGRLPRANWELDLLYWVPRSFAASWVRGAAVPGFVHQLHGSGDPRTARLLSLAAERGNAGRHVEALTMLERTIPDVLGKRLVANASGAVPAVLLDVGFPLAALKGIPILARTSSLLAHLHQESQRPIGFLMANTAKSSIQYDGPKPGE
jgi:citrate synthase